MALTLLPETLARRGWGFTFVGANAGPECAGCPFQKLCFGLQPGQRYEVTALRDVTHPCALHESGKVRVAEVAPAPFRSSVETRLLRGTAATWTPIPCGRPECPSWSLCHPVGPIPGARHQIVATQGTLECPAGYELTQASLQPMAPS